MENEASVLEDAGLAEERNEETSMLVPEDTVGEDWNEEGGILEELGAVVGEIIDKGDN